MIFYLALILLGLVLYHLSVHYSQLGRLVNKIPGPAIVPIFGNVLDLHTSMVKVNEHLRGWGKTYYPIYRLWFVNKAVIHIRHPDDLQILLTNIKQTDKDFAYEHFYPWLQTGLLTSVGQKWHQRRKILTPAFFLNILKKYLEITNEQSQKLVTDTRAKGKEIKIDLLPYCSNYTLNIICESTMGVSLDSKAHGEAALKYKAAVYQMGELMVYRMIRPYLRDWMIPYLPNLGGKTKEVVKNLSEFTNKVVEERREYHESTGYKYMKELQEDDTEEDKFFYAKKKRLAMLDLLLDAEKNGLMDDSGIKEEVATFIFAGHDTTAMAMCFSLMLLAENKEAQDKAREEVEKIINRNNGKFKITDFTEMNYLERCIKESLRLFPSVPIIVRHLTEDIQFTTYKAPKGSDIMMHFIDVHRDPQFWPEPEKFDPDRFLPDNMQGRHPFAFLPFSAGSRNCIGQKFAMMELKSVLAYLLYNFYIEPIDYTCDVVIQSDVVIRPNQPIHTKFMRIDRQTSF